MFTVAWWYMLYTYAVLWAGMLVSPVWFYIAVASCFVQAVHFGIEDRNPFSFSCQVRYVLLLIFVAGFWAHWIYWIVIGGLTVRLTANYCFLARLVSLFPWNRKERLTWALAKRTIFSKPVNGSILKEAL